MRKPQITLFEGSAVSDPLFAEPFTHAVSRAVEYFAPEEHSMFRFVTKSDYVDTLLHLEHRGKTRIRYSINTPRIIKKYEPGLPSLEKRLQAMKKLYQAGYPIGLMIAPIFLDAGWKEEYRGLFKTLAATGLQKGEHCLEKNNDYDSDSGKRNNSGDFRDTDNGNNQKVPGRGRNNRDILNSRDNKADITVEFITHRFTRRARENIEKVFPETCLLEHMNEEERRFKYGQFGYRI